MVRETLIWGFSTVNTKDIQSQVILCCGMLSCVCCRIQSTIPGLYILDASSTPLFSPIVTTKNVSRHLLNILIVGDVKIESLLKLFRRVVIENCCSYIFISCNPATGAFFLSKLTNVRRNIFNFQLNVFTLTIVIIQN